MPARAFTAKVTVLARTCLITCLLTLLVPVHWKQLRNDAKSEVCSEVLVDWAAVSSGGT